MGWLAVIAALVVPAAAFASAERALRDCTWDGDLDRSYSVRELRRAVDLQPSDVLEYGVCTDVLKAAIAAGSNRGKRDGSQGLGAVDPAAEALVRQQDEADLAALTTGATAPPAVRIAQTPPAPRHDDRMEIPTWDPRLPLPLLLALLAMSLLGLACALHWLRRRVPACSGSRPRTWRRS